MSTVLETRALVKCFGRFVATNGVNLRVQAGARHALIGPNGAGKTTLINLLTGFLEPTAGDVLLKGELVTRLPQHRRVQRGLVRTFQINRLFADLTVLESVLMAVNERLGLGARRPRKNAQPRVRQAAPARDRVGPGRAASGAAAGRAGCGRSRGREPRAVRNDRPAAA
jgi:ABC-type branched-subunit amino acid transport system ATPase component